MRKTPSGCFVHTAQLVNVLYKNMNMQGCFQLKYFENNIMNLNGFQLVYLKDTHSTEQAFLFLNKYQCDSNHFFKLGQ